MATLEALAERLRSELGDTGTPFLQTFIADGLSKTFLLEQVPVEGYSLIVKVDGEDVSSECVVNENTGELTLDVMPSAGDLVLVSGRYFRYFTNAEIQDYVQTAFNEHAATSTDARGARIQLRTLSSVEEYPLVILATSFALYTLATDAAFDIDIIAPDGVSIPRSERFRQLMELVEARKGQYRELCQMLGVGLYRIEVSTLRRKSQRTNRYSPVYIPQEIDDGSIPQRVVLPIPNYGSQLPPSTAISQDLTLIAGDDYYFELDFDIDLGPFTPASQIRLYPTPPANQVGPLLLGEFTISKTFTEGSPFPDRLLLTLPGDKTRDFPRVAYYDVQLTDPAGKVTTYVKGRIFTEAQVTR